MAKANDTFQIWHGSRRWDGAPEIRPAKEGRAEWGAGIYGTTHFETTAKYTKGGGKTQLLTIQATHVLEKTCFPVELAIDFIKRNVPKAKQSSLIEDCISISERMKGSILTSRSCIGDARPDIAWFPADCLRNLMVNAGMSSGTRGVATAKFFADLGIGISIDGGGSHFGEKWIVVYDPQLIVSWKAHTYESAKEIGHELPAPDAHTTEPVVYLRPASRYSSYGMER